MTQETSTPFGGFREDQIALIRVPDAFFTQLLPLIETLPLLQLMLYLFWHQEQQTGETRYFLIEDLKSDPTLLGMIGDEGELQATFDELVALGALLKAKPSTEDQTYYFINSPLGRAVVKAINNNNWQKAIQEKIPIHLTEEQPNIYQLYEENIGVITPMMAEILKDDEAVYPAAWIKDAIRIAVTRNKRNWKYIQAILERWQKEGRGYEQNRRDDSQDPKSYRESWLGHE